MLDSALHLSRRLAKQGLYPPIDPQTSRSRMLEEGRVGRDHLDTAEAIRRILVQYEAFQPTLEATGIDALSPADQTWVSRARKIERFLTQPFFVAEPYTGIPGKSVPIAETIRGCKAILAGQYDDLPEQAFYMIGDIDEAVARATA
jgi:F-type H+-transporting ATPase subunit beta